MDLSEWFQTFYSYDPAVGFPLKDGDSRFEAFTAGGNFYMLAPMLTSWVGPATEQEYPMNNLEVLEEDLPESVIRSQAAYHVTDAELLSYRVGGSQISANRADIKNAVRAGHAVSVSFLRNPDCYNTDTHAYYNDGTSSAGINHAVAIVGWDNAYPAANFRKDPGADGAWLVRNSYGPDSDDYGYFWISYEDATIYEMYYLRAETAQRHNKQYRYDDYGYWTAVSLENQDQTAYAANVFTAEQSAYLTSVMFCTAMPNEHYSIRVYKGLPAGTSDPTAGTASAVTIGQEPYTGYHTVDLIQPVMLEAGETFSIVIQLNGKSGQHIACEAASRYTTEHPDGTVTVQESILTPDMIESSFAEGQSFFSTNGDQWHDIYKELPVDVTYALTDGSTMNTYVRLGNICLRGLTQPYGMVMFSKDSGQYPEGTEIRLSCPGAQAIYYRTRNEEMHQYTEPITLTEDTDIVAYAVIDGMNYSSMIRSYHIQHAQLTGLLNLDDLSYVSFTRESEGVYAASIEAKNGVLHLLPTAMGTITSGEQSWHSYETMTIETGKASAVELRLSGEEYQDSIYLLYLGDVQGDVNLDGTVNAEDASLVLVYASQAGLGRLTSYPDAAWLKRADYNGDGTVNSEDASLILVHAAQAGLETN